MSRVVLFSVVGLVALNFALIVVVGLLRKRSAALASRPQPLAAPPPDLPDWVPSMAPGAVDLTPGASGFPDFGAIFGAVKAAAADGQLTEAELQAMFPGAAVAHDGTVTQVVAQTSDGVHVSVADGVQQYSSVDDIPDPVLREQVRSMLRGVTPPLPPPPA